MDGLEIASKLWLLISGFVVAVIGIVAYILKIKSDSREEHIVLQGKLNLMKQEIDSHILQNQKDHDKFDFVDAHLTKAGENIKEQVINFTSLVGDVRSEVALTKQSIDNLSSLMTEIKAKLDKNNL